MFEGFQRLWEYKLAEEFKILGCFHGLQGLKCFEGLKCFQGFKSCNAFAGIDPCFEFAT